MSDEHARFLRIIRRVVRNSDPDRIRPTDISHPELRAWFIRHRAWALRLQVYSQAVLDPVRLGQLLAADPDPDPPFKDEHDEDKDEDDNDDEVFEAGN